jgi:hypothetical protein
MKLSRIALVLATFALTPSAFAATLSNVAPAGKALDGVQVSKSASLTVEGRSSALTTVGAGIRTATLGIHAYEGELLVSDKAAYCAGGKGLANLAGVNAAAIRISVLFSFSKDKLIEALNAGFEANDVDTSNPDVAKVLAAIQAGPDAPRGDLIVFAGERLPDGTEALTYENSGKATTIHGKSGLVSSILALWLGNTDDSGLKNLNQALKSCNM